MFQNELHVIPYLVLTTRIFDHILIHYYSLRHVTMKDLRKVHTTDLYRIVKIHTTGVRYPAGVYIVYFDRPPPPTLGLIFITTEGGGFGRTPAQFLVFIT